MPRRKVLVSDSEDIQPRRPALSPEARENQMIALAMDLVEQRLRNGTASSQETTHFLKLATVKEQREREKTEAEIELLQAKIKNLESQSTSASLYADALKAFSTYSGNSREVSDEYNEEN